MEMFPAERLHSTLKGSCQETEQGCRCMFVYGLPESLPSCAYCTLPRQKISLQTFAELITDLQQHDNERLYGGEKKKRYLVHTELKLTVLGDAG